METLPVTLRPTADERSLLNDIHRWRNPTLGWFGSAIEGINRRMRRLSTRVLQTPGIDWTINNVVTGLLRITNDIMQDTLWREAIYRRYHEAGHAVYTVADIHRLDIEPADNVVRGLDIKYRAVAAAQGAAAGFVGVAGIVPDIVGLVALNLRAVGETATCYGYDMELEEERLFALQILYIASAPSVRAGTIPIGSVARKETAATLEQAAVSGSLRGMAQLLGARLTRAKLAQIIPVAGALAGGGFNAYYTTRVCEAALHLYRERRLLAKYSLAVLMEAIEQVR